MKEKYLFWACLFVCVITIGVTFLLSRSTQKEIFVVDTTKLFNGFSMKVELEELAKRKLLAMSNQVDSVRNLLKIAEAYKQEDNIKKMSVAYSLVTSTLESEYKKSDAEINEQVWKRINPLVEEYGKKHALKMIVGANGMGTVLYSDHATDATSDVIKYVNERYAQGN